MAFPVLLLNYKRPNNINHYILPALLKESCVSLVIIAHGEPSTVFGACQPLQDGEIQKIGKVWHIGDYANNTTYKCFRRWLLIEKLRSSLPGDCIMVQDDDVVFAPGELKILYTAYQEKKGVLVSGTYGRQLEGESYKYGNFFGKVELVLGQNIFGSVDAFCKAVKKITDANTPIDTVAFEDDIAMCCNVLVDPQEIRKQPHYAMNLRRTYLAQNDAVCNRPNHVESRTRAVQYWLVNKIEKT